MLKGDVDRLGIRPEHFTTTDIKSALVVATPDLVENLGENALVHCITENGMEFIVKTTDLSKFKQGKKIGLTTDKSRILGFNSTTQKRVG